MEGNWDLSCLYTGFDDPKFAEDLAALPGMIKDLGAILEGPYDPLTRLEKLYDASEALSAKMDDLGSFTYLTLSVDSENVQAMQAMGKLEPLSNEAALVDSAITRYVGSLDNLDELITASPKLQQVAFVLKERKASCSHLIPEAVEPWILDMQLSGSSAFSQLRDQLDATLEVDYHGEKLPLSAVRGLAYDPDPAVRKEAYEAELASYKKMELPMSYCLNSIKMEARTLAKAQSYPSVLDMTLDQSRMDRETLDAMLTAIREYLPDFRRYLKAKAKLLGHENGLPFYDLFAPIGASTKTYSIEEARAVLLKEMGKFTPEMAEFMDYAFEHRWIDLYPHAGKSGGAFCAPMHNHNRSAVMTNFQGSFSDISTLAHELGHAWHNHCMEGLPQMLCHEPMPLAETASIFNETMLAYQVRSTCSEEEKLTLLEASLMESTQTIVDIYSRYLFESEVIETRADHTMTVDELKDAMLRAQEAAYGDGLDPDCRHPYMWACKSHYYSAGLNFYNFPYAFGELFGKGVFALYLKQGIEFVPMYKKLLRSCGSDTVANVAASVGINVRDADFWRASLSVIREDIDTFCTLVEKA